MPVKVLIKKNAYYDSVTLMSVSKEVTGMDGVEEAVVAMATGLNKELLANVGMVTAEVQGATPNDLVIAVKAKDDQVAAAAVETAEQILVRRVTDDQGEQQRTRSLGSAFKSNPNLNLVLISVPGAYAAREARRALEGGRHVMLFSDNVTIEDEIALKKLARQKGLLMMGPDCGTAVINGVALAFANVVKRGGIGVVGASGTGTQEVISIIDKIGEGVSQVIGTGGRDLTAAVGGMMTMDAIRALQEDEHTRVLVVISKPPAPAVAQEVLRLLSSGKKPAVVHFIGTGPEGVEAAGLIPGLTLEDTAAKAVALAMGEQVTGEEVFPGEDLHPVARQEAAKLAPGQRYVRGLYTGGTLCDEAMFILAPVLGGVYSNVAPDPGWRLVDPRSSREHTMLDLGDDYFTVGRPHPMIEPSLRLPRFWAEANDPEVAVILLDVVLGHGVHPDPAGILAPVIAEAKEKCRQEGRYLSVVTSVCGTSGDPQGLHEQERKLREAGALVMASNARAARLVRMMFQLRAQEVMS
ncbi:hypothetical protein SY88_04895 [Clostridiales bacterium PH28_bin88]|nr:hypothetical protein SY88_04895 [Clostridiales bacterium PH28_bin88]